MKTNKERLEEMLIRLEGMSRIHSQDIPNIDLYMDQVTTFMDTNLKDMLRHPDDKVLTKTMINNYAKNNLLPSPVRKKYTKDHMIMLIFIYYFKNLLSFRDIEAIFQPLTEKHFGGKDSRLSLEDIYNEVFTLENEQMESLKKDLADKFARAEDTFQDEDTDYEDKDFLQLFSFICELSFDVYMKTQMLQMLADQLREENPSPRRK